MMMRQSVYPGSFVGTISGERAGARAIFFHKDVRRKDNTRMAMAFGGTQTIGAPIEKVWAFLLNVQNVAECAPGFQSLETLGEEHWKAIVNVGLGPVKAKFTLD